MPFANLTDQKIKTYYELHGEPQKPTLMLINGLTRDCNAWKKILPQLITDYYVVIFDNRGVGQTQDDGHPFTTETMTQDTIALMQFLHLDKPFLAGHSLGGAIAQIIAKQYPMHIRKVALCNTFIKLNAQAREAFATAKEVYENNGSPVDVVEIFIPWVFSKSFVTPEVRAMIHELAKANPYPQSKNDYQRQLDALNSFDSGIWVSEINIPTLVIASSEDITATLQESQTLAKQIPGALLEILPGAHGSYTEQPLLFTEKLKTLLKD